MKKRSKTVKSACVDVFDTMKAAAGGMGLPMQAIKSAKSAGCPAFRSGRIHADELRAWLAAHPEVAKAKDTTWRTKIEKERHRKLRLENEETEGRLISRAWMAERIHVAAAKVGAYRMKSEAEHPLLFAAAAGDVPACRAVVQKIWDEILGTIESLGGEFKEPKQKEHRD